MDKTCERIRLFTILVSALFELDFELFEEKPRGQSDSAKATLSDPV